MSAIELPVAVKTTKEAAIARVEVLRGIIAEKRAELARSWDGPGYSRAKVDALRSSVDSCRSEINAIRRSWGFPRWLEEGPPLAKTEGEEKP